MLDLAFLTGDERERRDLALTAELLRRGLSSSGLPLLRPPRAGAADAEVRLGRVVHGPHTLGWLGVTPSELTHHLLCVGRTGCGKSNLLVRVLLQLSAQGTPWIAIDHKRSLRSLLNMELAQPVRVVAQGRRLHAELAFNPLCPPRGVPFDTHARQVVDLIAGSWTTGDGVRALLLRTILACKRGPSVPTFVQVRNALADHRLGGREAQWRVSALRVLDQLTTGPPGRMFCTRADAAVIDHLLTARTIIEMDGLSLADSAFFVSLLLRALVCELQNQPLREQLRLAIAIDEAHHILSRHEGGREHEAARVLREGRESGLGCLLATQTFGGLDPVAMANCGTLVVMNCRHASDLHAGTQGLLLQDEERPILSLLPVGQAVVRLASRWPHPVHIQVPVVPLAKGSVSDLDVTRAFLLGPFAVRQGGNQRLAESSGESMLADRAQPAPERPGFSTSPTTTSHTRPAFPIAPSGTVYDVAAEDVAAASDSRALDFGRFGEAGSFGNAAGSGGSGGSAPNSARPAATPTVPAVPGPDAAGEEFRVDCGTHLDPLMDQGSLSSSSLASLSRANTELAALLRHIAEHPLVGVAARYDALGLSRRKGDALKDALVQHGALRPVSVPIPRGRVLLLELTEDGRDAAHALGATIAAVHGSLPHAYWQQQAADLLHAQGWSVGTEVIRNDHAFDVLATRGDHDLALEVETGKSNWLSNLAALEAVNATHRAVLWLDPARELRARSLAPSNVLVLRPSQLDPWIKSVDAGRSATIHK
ncbi:MAG: ATP-binding protein [Phycisphaerales bacterium]|nr:ATP-binding protein [Phycisphaerales bacterium]